MCAWAALWMAIIIPFDNHPVLIVASTRPDIAVTARVDVTGNWQDALSGEVFAATNGTLIVPLSPGDGRVLVKQ